MLLLECALSVSLENKCYRMTFLEWRHEPRLRFALEQNKEKEKRGGRRRELMVDMESESESRKRERKHFFCNICFSFELIRTTMECYYFLYEQY